MSVVLKTLPAVTVAVSGTEQRLSALAGLQNVVKLWISSPSANTGSIFVGDTSVSTTVGTEVPKGVTMVICDPAGGMLDLNNIWIDAANNNDRAFISYLQKVSR